jgi:hypothetical protein
VGNALLFGGGPGRRRQFAALDALAHALSAVHVYELSVALASERRAAWPMTSRWTSS